VRRDGSEPSAAEVGGARAAATAPGGPRIIAAMRVLLLTTRALLPLVFLGACDGGSGTTATGNGSSAVGAPPRPVDPEAPGGDMLIPRGGASSSRGGAHADLFREDGFEPGKSAKPVVLLRTTAGDLRLTLDRKAAPATTANFLDYVRSGFYQDVVFHRVVPGVLVQAGAFDAAGAPKRRGPAIAHEGANNLAPKRGAVCLWRRDDDPHSGTSEFFINLADNDGRRPGSKNFGFQSENRGPAGWGYVVFGSVKDDAPSLQTLDALGAVAVGPNAATGDERSKPESPPRILSAEIVRE